MSTRFSVRQLAFLGLLLNATVWGLSWIGFKSVGSVGLNPLWMTAAISGVSFLVFVVLQPSAVWEVLRTPALRWVLLGAGLTNICFNTAVALGDVLRVTLLFYLMPVWAALLAHWFLGEVLTRVQTLRLLMGLCGAALVLWQPHIGLPVPVTLSDWLGVAGGFFFALNNVGLRGAQHASDLGRSQAMFMGGLVCSTVLAVVLASAGIMSWPSAVQTGQWGLIGGQIVLWSALFLLANYGVQYGAARLPANLTALIMLTEILIAGVSSAWLGASALSWNVLAGGVLILLSPFLGPRSTPQS
jgi:drug/metabolite transporter (DMT)-like permease